MGDTEPNYLLNGMILQAGVGFPINSEEFLGNGDQTRRHRYPPLAQLDILYADLTGSEIPFTVWKLKRLGKMGYLLSQWLTF